MPKYCTICVLTLLIVSGCGGGGGDSESVAPPAPNTAPQFTSESYFGAPENSRSTGYTATADDDGDTLKFHISGGDDQALFVLDANSGILSFLEPKDYESPSDHSGDGVYTIVLTVSDGEGVSDSLLLDIDITDVNEAPEFVSADTLSVIEGSVGFIYLAEAKDPDYDPLEYAIEGEDSDFFAIDSVSGQLALRVPLSFADFADQNGGSQCEISLIATDKGHARAEMVLTVSIESAVAMRYPIHKSELDVHKPTTTVSVSTADIPDIDKIDINQIEVWIKGQLAVWQPEIDPHHWATVIDVAEGINEILLEVKSNGEILGRKAQTLYRMPIVRSVAGMVLD